MANPKIVVPRLYDGSLGLLDQKTILKSKFKSQYFVISIKGINQIYHEEFENHVPETLGTILMDPRLKAS